MTSINNTIPQMTDNPSERNISEGYSDPAELVRLVNFWKNRIQSTKKLRIYDEFKKNKDEARSFYRGDTITDTDRSAWEGDTVQANLFRRVVNFMSDAVYSQSPSIKVGPRTKIQDNPQAEHYATVIQTHLEYIWDEEKQGLEVRRVFKDSYFGNLSAAKIDFDKSRGLFRGKWVAGDLVCDPNAHGDLSRARWLAELVQLPRYQVWQDETFDLKARDELRKRSNQSEDQTYSDIGGNYGIGPGPARADLENIWYIYTKEGVEPLNPESKWNASTNGIPGKGKIRLLVVAENFDKFLLNIENPTPYLEADEFPYAILRLDELPGEFIGPALWRQVESICRSFNWACSYHMTDMRKSASHPIGYDEDRVSDPDVLKNRKHKTLVPVKGDPKTAVAPFDVGQSDDSILKSVEFFRGLLDKVTGIDDIARGEEGKIKTATESQILQQNSSVTLKGPQTALDNFMQDLIRKLGLATLYYTPAWSITVGQNNILMTKMVQQVPVQPPLPVQGMGTPYPGLTGAGIPPVIPPMMMPQIVEIPAQLTPEQAQLFGAQLIPGQPDPITGQVGMSSAVLLVTPDPTERYLIKGIDFFHGDQLAQMWPQLDFNDIKYDLDFTIEAGSSRAERRNERQRAAMALFETFGQLYQQFGFWENYWELLNIIITAFDLFNMDRILPDKQKFIQQAAMMQQMQQMMAQQQSLQQQQKHPNPQSGKFNESKNTGKTFPGNEDGGGPKGV